MYALFDVFLFFFFLLFSGNDRVSTCVTCSMKNIITFIFTDFEIQQLSTAKTIYNSFFVFSPRSYSFERALKTQIVSPSELWKAYR